MKEKLNKLYRELKDKITISRLKEISVVIINKFKSKDYRYLVQFAKTVGIESANLDTNRVFAKIIQVYHPDKFTIIHKEIDSRFKDNNFEELLRLKNTYLVDLKTIRSAIDYTYEDQEEQYYGEEDFGYDEFDLGKYAEMYEYEEEEQIFEDAYAVYEHNFIQAVNEHFFGNLEHSVSMTDLRNLDGELDLSDFDITDLDGLENCTNISVLNLAGNNIIKIHQLCVLSRLEALYLSENDIEDISCLDTLSKLVELDISFNHIDDISVLLELGNLKYVNILQNPVSDLSVIEKLKKKGVIVIY